MKVRPLLRQPPVDSGFPRKLDILAALADGLVGPVRHAQRGRKVQPVGAARMNDRDVLDAAGRADAVRQHRRSFFAQAQGERRVVARAGMPLAARSRHRIAFHRRPLGFLIAWRQGSGVEPRGGADRGDEQQHVSDILHRFPPAASGTRAKLRGERRKEARMQGRNEERHHGKTNEPRHAADIAGARGKAGMESVQQATRKAGKRERQADEQQHEAHAAPNAAKPHQVAQFHP